MKKATEYGAVEIWMNERVRRACASSCADFIYGFLEVLLNLPKNAVICYYFDEENCTSNAFVCFSTWITEFCEEKWRILAHMAL